MRRYICGCFAHGLGDILRSLWFYVCVCTFAYTYRAEYNRMIVCRVHRWGIAKLLDTRPFSALRMLDARMGPAFHIAAILLRYWPTSSAACNIVSASPGLCGALAYGPGRHTDTSLIRCRHTPACPNGHFVHQYRLSLSRDAQMLHRPWKSTKCDVVALKLPSAAIVHINTPSLYRT